MDFKISGTIEYIETIAEGNGIHELVGLKKQFGLGNWKKKKGVATVVLTDGTNKQAEIHWYEAHGIGKVKLKIKRWL
jgi:myo-inositol-hexaphosphate 3-phosphohydrolase